MTIFGTLLDLVSLSLSAVQGDQTGCRPGKGGNLKATHELLAWALILVLKFCSFESSFECPFERSFV